MKKISLILFVLFSFVSSSYSQVDSLHCHTGGTWSIPSWFTINNIQIEQGTCNNFDPKIQVAVMDSCSFIPWTDDSCLRYFGQLNYASDGTPCGQPHPYYSTCINVIQPLSFFLFDLTVSTQVDSLVSMLNNKIPNGYHLLAYMFSSYTYSLLPQYNAFKNAFLNLGSVMINTLPDTVPFIFYVKKGFPGTVAEVRGNSSSDAIDLYVKMPCATTDVNEIENSYSAVSLFPNPATNQLTISSRQWAIKEIEIYDVVGEKQIALPLNPLKGTSATIDVSGLAAGIYFVRARGEKMNAVVKFVKQ